MRDLLRSVYFRIYGLLARFLPETALRVFRSLAARLARRLYADSVAAKDPALLKSISTQYADEPALAGLPAWLLEDLEEIKHIDPRLHPKGTLVTSATPYAGPWTYDAPGLAYFEIARAIPADASVFLLVPWLKTGGADLGAIQFANTLAAEFGKRVVVIATEDAASSWQSRLREDVVFVEAGRLLHGLPEQFQVDVVVRLVLQFQPEVLHVMNSALAWKAIRRNGLALRQGTRIFASLYCDDLLEDGRVVGYAQDYLVACSGVLDGVISDNAITPQGWVARFGLAPGLFHVVPFPAPALVQAPPDPGARRILWAGRLDRQKRPDLLAEIARRCPDYAFDVYGRSVIPGDAAGKQRFPGNVTLCGGFESFATIAAQKPYAAYLYTSQWDGLPNVLLEACAAGLPVVASDVGGIADLLDAEQRVAPFDDVDGYVARLNQLARQPVLGGRWQARQYEALGARHSREHFVQALREIPGYLA